MSVIRDQPTSWDAWREKTKPFVHQIQTSDWITRTKMNADGRPVGGKGGAPIMERLASLSFCYVAANKPGADENYLLILSQTQERQNKFREALRGLPERHPIRLAAKEIGDINVEIRLVHDSVSAQKLKLMNLFT